MAVVEEAAVAVDARVGPFPEDRLHPVHFQSRRELRSSRTLNAMIWPQHLRKAGELVHLAGLTAGASRREAAMARGMPVLRRNHEVENRLDAICHRNDLVTARDGQRSAREEVVLDIDEDQRSHHLLHDTSRMTRRQSRCKACQREAIGASRTTE